MRLRGVLTSVKPRPAVAPSCYHRRDHTRGTGHGAGRMDLAIAGKTALVTGASSGIGREVALLLASRGARVAVSARSADSLAELCRLDERLTAYPLDVTDRAACAAVIDRIEAAQGAIDLAILNAGIWQPMGASHFDAEKAEQSMAVNYLGLANPLERLIPLMIGRGWGHLALTSSVAGYRGLPQSAAYAPSKAAVISLAETLAPDLARKGVGMSVINPGFVDTPMTRVNRFPMPFLMQPDAAARAIVRGLERGRFEIAFPWQLVTLLKIARVLPYPLFFWFSRTFLMPKKPQ